MDSATNLPPFLAPNFDPEWVESQDAHAGFDLLGLDGAPGKKAYFIHLEARPGKEDQLQAFLRDINTGVNQEPLTGPWFGTRYSKSTFVIFEAFPSVEARHAHDAGPGGRNFLKSDLLKEVLAQPARIYRLDVLHGKFDVLFGSPVTTEA